MVYEFTVALVVEHWYQNPFSTFPCPTYLPYPTPSYHAQTKTDNSRVRKIKNCSFFFTVNLCPAAAPTQPLSFQYSVVDGDGAVQSDIHSHLEVAPPLIKHKQKTGNNRMRKFVIVFLQSTIFMVFMASHPCNRIFFERR